MMASNLKKVLAGAASALIVAFAIACSGQPSQEQPKPASETSQTQPATPPEGAAPAEGTAPAQGNAPAPAEGQQAPPQQ